MDETEAPVSLTQEEKNQALACHLLSLTGLVVPFGGLIGPLVMWLVKRDESAFVDAHGKEAVNFNITMMIAFFVAFLSMFVFIGFILLPIIGLFWLIMTIIAGIEAGNGKPYRYPLTIRFIN